MEQHPIPQHISSYQFRLIGEMTLSQFGKLAGGIIVALVFYALPLPGFIKWFLILLAAGTGAAFAFVPLEGRSLETWIAAFIKSIYSPTEYVWQKSKIDFSFLRPDRQEGQTLVTPHQETTRSLSVKELALLKALGNREDFYTPEEISQAQSILKLFQAQSEPIISANIIQPKIATAHPLPTEEAQFNQKLPFPSAPDQPNVLVGMVIDKNGKIVEGAIIEIKDDNGDTVRAMRTNKLGQFRTVSALPDNQYQISIEKEGLNFDIIKIQLRGEIVSPIEIRENSQKLVN
jgi:hypothetical protein